MDLKDRYRLRVLFGSKKDEVRVEKSIYRGGL
jgi:hypothetical protein